MSGLEEVFHAKTCPFCGSLGRLVPDDYVHDDLAPLPVVECANVDCRAWVPVESWDLRAVENNLLEALIRARDDLNNAAFLIRKEIGESGWLYGIEKGKKIADEAIKLAEGDKS